MCGIAGYSGSLDGVTLSKMNTMQAHRGPDDEGIWIDKINGVGLAHRRLSIQDTSPAGHQPLKSTDGSVYIIYNGEIYNTLELRRELESAGSVFRGRSDTEVILNLYLKYGYKLLSKLNGIFAFAIWDKKKRELFLARDGLGVKPLYYTQTPEAFVFASELKALLINQGIAKDINEKAVVSHLTYLWCPTPDTMLKGIYKLEPGTALLVGDGAIKKKWCFYDIPYRASLSKLSESEAIAETRNLISQAVRRQLISDVPVGAFLSGGLDSSAVVAFAKHQIPETKLQAFSIDLQGIGRKSDGIVDDLPYAKKVAAHLDVELNVITVGSEIISDLEKMIYHLDEPQADPAPLNVLYISKLAREQGIKVLLSGTGGDDIFTGYRRHYALLQERYWAWLPQYIRNVLSKIANGMSVSNHSLRRASKAFQYAGYDMNKRLVSYFYWLNPDYVHEIVSTALNEQLCQYEIASPLLDTLDRLPVNVHPLNKLLYLEGKHFLVDHNLNYTDKMGMAEGVEIRVPLLDRDVVDFATSIPTNYKQRGRTGKWIFKKAMEGILPNDVIYRPKSGFGAPLRYWLRGELKDVVDDVLSATSIKKRGIFDLRGVQRLRKLDAEGRIDAAYPIFSMICMEIWCRNFIDKPMPSY